MNAQHHPWAGRLLVGLAAAALTVTSGAQAGDHWLSKVRVKTSEQPEVSLPASLAASGRMGAVLAASSSPQTIFDITISLDADPQEDDEKEAYEERIKEFAKAVYQSTNGAHQIGRVSIFRNRDFRASADVHWDEQCTANEGPRAHPSGFGKAGRYLWMCTLWPGAQSLMPTPKGGGYTLAHEWGHYAYGLYDEYVGSVTCDDSTWPGRPCITDTETVPSIMNNQWNAARVNDPNLEFLEFSTPNVEPFTVTSTGSNAQKRVFDESAWETLTRDPATDPDFDWLPERTRYMALNAPTDPNWLVSVDEADALDELDIRWMGPQVLDLSVDVSGSMGGRPIENAKTGAKLLIDQVLPGSALGVSAFESTVTRHFDITEIPELDTGVRDAAKFAVDGLIAEGLTALYDGLMFSLDDIQAFDPNRPGIVYVLSDGGDNASTATEAEVVAAYEVAGIPIISFAYGSFAPTGPLWRMAQETGGAFYQSPTTLAEIQSALLSAQARFSSNVLLSSADEMIGGGKTKNAAVAIDDTL